MRAGRVGLKRVIVLDFVWRETRLELFNVYSCVIAPNTGDALILCTFLTNIFVLSLEQT